MQHVSVTYDWMSPHPQDIKWACMCAYARLSINTLNFHLKNCFSLISPHTRSTILSNPQLLTKLRCKLVILRK